VTRPALMYTDERVVNGVANHRQGGERENFRWKSGDFHEWNLWGL